MKGMVSMSSNDNNIADLLPDNKNNNEKRKKWSSLISDIRTIEEESEEKTSTTFLPSSLLKEQDKKEKSNKHEEDDEDTGSDWLTTIGLLCSKPSKKKIKKASDDLFESAGIKKKKKKHKKDANDLIDYKREFEPEMALYKNLLISQNKFTESLQKNYDQIMALKSSNRGVTKQLTDLIENINDARTLSMQLVEKNINAKKTIAELSMKQKEKFGSGNLGDGNSLSDYASIYLKQMMNEKQSLMNGSGSADISDYSEDELLDAINLNLGDEETDEVDNVLKYESANAKVYVEITDNNIQDYEFIAKDDDGNTLSDYPLPIKSNISVNRSTDIATDVYGRHYPIIWNNTTDDNDILNAI
jgi:hypothetical protein